MAQNFDCDDLAQLAKSITNDVTQLTNEIDGAIERINIMQDEITEAKEVIWHESVSLEDDGLTEPEINMANLRIEFAVAKKNSSAFALRKAIEDLSMARIRLHRTMARMDEFDELAQALRDKHLVTYIASLLVEYEGRPNYIELIQEQARCSKHKILDVEKQLKKS
ncbi:MAG: hypothetical protein ATN33_04465 [Epulopiscium sp. Nele67-Bin001]|nr:MAG: hypothetical protein ATN33_04465 [Epulopiscium sp. Nele67-Bin001]